MTDLKDSILRRAGHADARQGRAPAHAQSKAYAAGYYAGERARQRSLKPSTDVTISRETAEQLVDLLQTIIDEFDDAEDAPYNSESAAQLLPHLKRALTPRVETASITHSEPSKQHD